ncbi:triacylglycerol lipase [Oscillospiraceae bacterium]|nr:triacylglycerol lipase [Oscillospiraceae bacterium]
MLLSLIVFILYSNIAVIAYFAGMEEAAVPAALIGFLPFVLCVIFPSYKKIEDKRIRKLQRGVALLIEFLITCVVDAGMLITYLVYANMNEGIASDIVAKEVIIAVIAGNIIFWSGIITVYVRSKQLGFKWRVIGILCGMIPIAHLVALGYIIRITFREYRDENARYILNKSRVADKICQTKYPILMVHGVFFRDSDFFNYWGRIPADLEENGATIFYGDQESAASVDECGKQLAAKIKEIVEKNGCGKVNIIAHSKGGLDSRAAISLCGAAPYVASLTTINSPHYGCQFADYLLTKAPDSLRASIASKYNAVLTKVGDKKPDFLAAVSDLTDTSCKAFNERCPNSPDVYYQSVGSTSVKASGGRFPLNLSYHLVKHFDGVNDGLVSLPSMKWGDNFEVVKPRKKRGITHGDMIDLMRENIDGFDVRETYVKIVSGLKERGF